MKLDRNTDARRSQNGKYAIITLRDLRDPASIESMGEMAPTIMKALATLEAAGLVQYSQPGTLDEFFVIKLKDRYAQSALRAYADAAVKDDPEYAGDIHEMAERSGPSHPDCKMPD